MAIMHWHLYPLGGALLFWLWLRFKARKSFPVRRRPLMPRYSKQRLDVMRERNRRIKQKETEQDDERQV